MINILKSRIEMCKKVLLVHENQIFPDEEQWLYNQGLIEGIKGELKTLNELLISAQTLEELERSA